MEEFRIEVFMHSIIMVHEHKKMISLKHRTKVYELIKKAFADKNCRVEGIGGTENHIHIVHEISVEISPDDLLKKTKLSTQQEIRTSMIPNFLWEEGYYMYSISRSNVERECLLLLDEYKKHKTMTLAEELKKIRKDLEMIESDELTDINENNFN